MIGGYNYHILQYGFYIAQMIAYHRTRTNGAVRYVRTIVYAYVGMQFFQFARVHFNRGTQMHGQVKKSQKFRRNLPQHAAHVHHQVESQPQYWTSPTFKVVTCLASDS